jgi:preprotein translocase subunit YajC
MQLKLNVFVAALAISLPAAAAAQMSGQASPPAQEPQSSTALTRQANEPAAAAAEVKPATAADIKAGVEVFDQKGGAVGKVESVAADGVVVSTGTVKAKIPASSLGKSDKGLVIAMTKSEFEAAAKKAPSS